jgi:hypothetical protein
VHISFGKGYLDTVPVGHDVSFEQFVKLIREMPRHHGKLTTVAYALAGKRERGRDKDSRWFIPAVFVRPERVADAVLELSAFVCDFDDGVIDRSGLAGLLAGLRYVAWTSYSHGVDGNARWRVVIPYDKAIAPAEHTAVYEHFQKIFDGHLDPRCATISQLWYLPGHPKDATNHEVFADLNGQPFSPSVLDRDRKVPQTGGVAGGLVGVLAARAKDNDDLTARGPTSIRDLTSALNSLPTADYGDYTRWLNIGMAVFDGAQGSYEGYEIFDAWSQKCPNYGGPESTSEKWASFGGRAGLTRITSATLFKQAQEAGWSGAVDNLPVQPPSHPDAPPPQLSQLIAPANPPAGNGNSGIPAQLVLPLIMTAPVPMPDTWRAHPTEFAMQRKVDDPNTGNQMWQTALRGSRVLSLEMRQDIAAGDHAVELTCENGSGRVVATFTSGEIAEVGFRGYLALRGVITLLNEFKHLQDFIMDWLKKIQAAQSVRQSFTHLGWMEKNAQAIGFALGETAYFADGRVETGIKVAVGGGTTIAKHYIPTGSLQAWKSVSQFLSSQGRPELMAILATSFGSPLMKFSGHSGAVVSIVSTASGVGKSTALSLAQSVWGNPKSAIHSATDTVLSLSSKMGFTKDLPAYWDDIKGEKVLKEFASVIYQITQGKEKARLTQQATLREVETWNCLAVVAANDSIIEVVKQYGTGTDAGAARIFEIRLEERPPMSQVATFFDQCTTNYGRAGEIYAGWLARNHDRAKRLVESVSARLSTELQAESEERFWIAAMSTMLAGAMIAKQLQLVDFDVPTLSKFLTSRFLELRGSKSEAVKATSAGPIVKDILFDYQPGLLVINTLPSRDRGAYNKTMTIRPPKNGQVDILLAEAEQILRIRIAKFNEWCREKSLSSDTLAFRLRTAGVLRQRNVDPMAGTRPYSTGSRTACYDIDLSLLEGVSDGTPETTDP